MPIAVRVAMATVVLLSGGEERGRKKSAEKYLSRSLRSPISVRRGS